MQAGRSITTTTLQPANDSEVLAGEAVFLRKTSTLDADPHADDMPTDSAPGPACRFSTLVVSGRCAAAGALAWSTQRTHRDGGRAVESEGGGSLRVELGCAV